MEELVEERAQAGGKVGHRAAPFVGRANVGRVVESSAGRRDLPAVHTAAARLAYDPAMTPATMAAITLTGRIVRLEPLSLDHVPGLADVGLDPAIWRWTIARPTSEADLRAWAETAIEAADAGRELPFATVDAATNRPIGSTRYLNFVPEHRRVEIGWTWLAPRAQRSGANRESKLLMLSHAFDAWACRRVEFKTDSRNERSRAALLGIGATFEGIFRNHMVMPDGPMRHSAYYSVIDDEWPDVKARLERLIRA
jgi:RimJ/RimL family protein N-acetyltransferase